MNIPIIATLTETDVGATAYDFEINKSRVAARALVFNADGKFAMYRPGPTRPYRLPGGGVEKRETLEKTVERETYEEIGAKIKITSGPIAQIIEVKNAKRIRCTNIYFTANIVSLKLKRRGRMLYQKYSPSIITPDWFTFDEAIQIMRDTPHPKKYKDKFVLARELKFLEYMRDKAGE